MAFGRTVIHLEPTYLLPANYGIRNSCNWVRGAAASEDGSGAQNASGHSFAWIMHSFAATGLYMPRLLLTQLPKISYLQELEYWPLEIRSVCSCSMLVTPLVSL